MGFMKHELLSLDEFWSYAHDGQVLGISADVAKWLEDKFEYEVESSIEDHDFNRSEEDEETITAAEDHAKDLEVELGRAKELFGGLYTAVSIQFRKYPQLKNNIPEIWDAFENVDMVGIAKLGEDLDADTV